NEVRRLVEEGYAEATKILTEKREQLEVLAKGLIEYETLSGDEIRDLLEGRPPVRGEPAEAPAPRSTAVPKGNRPRPDGASGGMEPQPQA
ncbi:MAG: cell division protein FtsH, partial [Xanthobacteraceae bacterium]